MVVDVHDRKQVVATTLLIAARPQSMYADESTTKIIIYDKIES